ncbi:MFS transporter [Nocardiopsis sp. N85]|uniref:MFS transporter n=1 Tax=Nocardiopsis sp. N85 TaxID=3029400 RepID=UPI00237F7F31|nr:MFS transporter [Nocardiopsis sp. N85]MDE3723347.1 MFS transporter [Nocardiopsis sp. N85]
MTTETRAVASPPVPENSVAQTPWRRHFALLWSGGALNGLGTMTFTLAVPLLALAQTGSPVTAAWIAVAGMLPRILLHAPVGVLVDRVDPRRVMIIGQTGRLAVTVLLVPPVLLWDAPVSLLIAAMAVHGICSTLFATAATAAVPHLVPEEHLAEAVGRNEARAHGTQMTGRPLGGLLFGLAAWAPTAFNVVMSSGALLTALFLPRPVRPAPVDRDEEREPFIEEFRAGFRWLYRDRLLRSALVVCTITNAMFQTVWLLIMSTVTHEGFPPVLIGVVLAATGVGGLLGSLLAPRLVRRFRPVHMIALCLWSWMLPLGALAVAHHLDPRWLMATLPFTWGGIGFVGAHMNVTVGTYHAVHVPRNLLGRVLGVDQFFAQGAMPLGLVCGGHLLEAWGPGPTSALLAAANGGIALVFTVLMVVLSRPRARTGNPAVAVAPDPGPL